MNLTSLGILSASVLLGVGGAGAAYQLTALDAPEKASPSVPVPPATQAAQPPTRWAPCNPPAVLEGKECVVDVTRTVTLPGAPAPAAPVPASAPAPAPASVRAAAAPATGTGPDGPGTQEHHGAGTSASGETGDCEVREDHVGDRDDCGDRDHDTSGNDHDDDDSKDAQDDAADAAEDAADAAEDAADDRNDEDD